MRDQRTARAIVLVFLAALAIPLLAGVAGAGRQKPAAEVADDAPPHPGPQWLDDYDQRFPFRAALIHRYALASFAIGVSPSPTVIKGRDGWLYYADDSALDDYISATPLSQEELDAWRDSIVHTRDALRAKGIAYVFTIAPDKHVIYPEHMPESIHPLGREYRLQQLTEYLQRTTDVAVVDLRRALLDAKQRDQVYFRTDTHWNEAGAYAAYRELMRAAESQMPALTAAPGQPISTELVEQPGGDIADMLGVRDDVHETVPRVQPAGGSPIRVDEPADLSAAGFEVPRVVTSTTDSKAPRLLMIRDSFGSALIPFLSRHFSRAVYLWQPNLDMDDVQRERPTLVIQEIVGRRLQTYQP